MAEAKKPKLPIEALINHLIEYKDAVIILGPDILEEGKQFEISPETYECYNRKIMIKEIYKNKSSSTSYFSKISRISFISSFEGAFLSLAKINLKSAMSLGTMSAIRTACL